MARVLDCFGACEVATRTWQRLASAEVHTNSSLGRRAGEGAGRDIEAAAGLDNQHTSFLEEAIISIFTPQVRV